MRSLWVRRDNRIPQGGNDFGFNMVAEVTAGLWRGQSAPSILHLFFLRQSVRYPRKQRYILR